MENGDMLEPGNASLFLRPITEPDKELLKRIYGSTRLKEMEMVPHWKESEKTAFIQQQFEAQHVYYQDNYKGAYFWVIEKTGIPIGRLYLHPEYSKNSIRIIDITLLPEFRRQGIGEQLLKDIIALGCKTGRPVSIHVESFNPAINLYKRLGFRIVDEKNGVYYLMEWKNN
jgi:ribosomal protein S18 acetylase RimI-like enzyme